MDREGVYVWRRRRFEQVNPPSEYVVPLNRDDLYLVYFHNLDCSHCARFKPSFEKALAEESVEDDVVYMAVCKWFTIECSDEKAKRAFSLYRVRSSPAVLAVLVRDGRISYTTNLYTLAVIHRAVDKARDILETWRLMRARVIGQRG